MNLLIEAARSAGEIATSFSGKTARQWEKGDGAGPVSEADLAVNSMLEEYLLASRPDKMDQDAYNTAISNWKRRTDEPLTLSIMDPASISNGWVFFMRRLGQRENADMVAVHNNWAAGLDGNSYHQKARLPRPLHPVPARPACARSVRTPRAGARG